MPTVSVVRDELFEKIGENFGAKPEVPCKEADDKFDELCFEFGVELDDVTSEEEVQRKETGKASANASKDILYKIDVPANRYDLLCIEGIARSFRVFLGKEKAPKFHASAPPSGSLQKITILPDTQKVRPILVAAILRNFTFNKKNYKSFIDLQEKLHQNICRQRSIVSIGTHDLDTIEGPFTYEALPRQQIKFIPLQPREKEGEKEEVKEEPRSMNGEELFKHLRDKDSHLKKFLPLLDDEPLWPVIYDKNRRVLSLPPIINGEHSKITLNTKNVLIEVTATDATKAEIVLNMMVSMFSEYCADAFSVEQVEVVSSNGKSAVTPPLTVREMEVKVDYIIDSVGVRDKLTADGVAPLLTKMSLTSVLAKDKSKVTVTIPITRSDILHPCDVMEDAAIGHGYNNITVTLPKVSTEGYQQPLNKLTDQLRREIAFAGFTEVLTFSLCSRSEVTEMLNLKEEPRAVGIENPKTVEFEVGRTTLLVGILKIVHNNRHHPVPLRLFELSDVILKDSQKDVGAKNQRVLCAVHVGQSAGFDVVHGLLDSVMKNLGVSWQEEGKPSVKGKKYQLKPSENPTFFPAFRADVYYNDEKIGSVGVLHPKVLQSYKLAYPVAALEINVEPLL
eukprot:TRINITY_DN1772_c0_g2_i1.p1 TRINITY_DN1772_c0_g2~~TRINITY_DN1772_c0_g2_i1.p1  ORF type:complete len:621 (+),score=217.99 TRINITY_DN1772_c0_g2_i1:96-1958(+)